MDFKQPVVVYTAASNLEAHLIVDMLEAHGVPAYAVEDQSGVSLWALGRISQFHKPKIWVEEVTLPEAVRLIQAFEENNRQRNNPDEDSGTIQAICEECGKTSEFPGSLNGTTQTCPHCSAYLDVGEFPDDEEFDTPEDVKFDTPEDEPG